MHRYKELKVWQKAIDLALDSNLDLAVARRRGTKFILLPSTPGLEPLWMPYFL